MTVSAPQVLTFVAVLAFMASNCMTAQPSTSPSASYYISSSSGDDNNDGRSPDRPWQHLSKIMLRSISANPFKPGDRILLRRGDLWHEQIQIRANGTAERPILVSDYGQGTKPLIYGDIETPLWQPVAGHEGIYTVSVGNGSQVGVLQGAKFLKFVYPAGALKSKEQIDNFLGKFGPGMAGPPAGDRIWVRTVDGGPPNLELRVFRFAGVSVSNSSYTRIENLDVQRFSEGVDVESSHHIVVRSNDIQDVLGIGIYLRLADANCLIEGNTVYRAGNTALYVLKGTANVFRDNWVSHVDAKILGIPLGGDKQGIGLQESSGTLVERNYFANSGGIDFYFEHDSTIRYNYLQRVSSSGSPHGVNLRAYGNIYNLTAESGSAGATGINAVTTGPGVIEVTGNTVYNARGYSLKGSSAAGGKVIFADNIVSSPAQSGTLADFQEGVTASHNCYFGKGTLLFRYGAAQFGTLKDYQQASGQDKGSVFANPQFLSSVPNTPLDFAVTTDAGCKPPAQMAPFGAANPSNSAKRESLPTIRVDSCATGCFEHPFHVPRAVYLVRLKLSAALLSDKTSRSLALVLNGRRMSLDFTVAGSVGGSVLQRDFLVRPSNAILLSAEKESDSAAVSSLEIVPFDGAYGDGEMVLAW